jgi:hypothetical protein
VWPHPSCSTPSPSPSFPLPLPPALWHDGTTCAAVGSVLAQVQGLPSPAFFNLDNSVGLGASLSPVPLPAGLGDASTQGDMTQGRHPRAVCTGAAACVGPGTWAPSTNAAFLDTVARWEVQAGFAWTLVRRSAPSTVFSDRRWVSLGVAAPSAVHSCGLCEGAPGVLGSEPGTRSFGDGVRSTAAVAQVSVCTCMCGCMCGCICICVCDHAQPNDVAFHQRAVQHCLNADPAVTSP